LIDTGAAAGLIGSETLRLYSKDVLVPQNIRLRLLPSSATFVAGIGGAVQPSLGRVVCPSGLALPGASKITLGNDIVGSGGASCPGLLPPPVQLEWKPAACYLTRIIFSY